jgi:hypothetical protein
MPTGTNNDTVSLPGVEMENVTFGIGDMPDQLWGLIAAKSAHAFKIINANMDNYCAIITH